MIIEEEKMIKGLKISRWVSVLYLLVSSISWFIFPFINGIMSKIAFVSGTLFGLLAILFAITTVRDEIRLYYLKTIEEIKSWKRIR